jgi:hypothetical protein
MWGQNVGTAALGCPSSEARLVLGIKNNRERAALQGRVKGDLVIGL